jgi:uncharacterized membrane protein YbaN (DUF454 family)
MDAKIPTIVFFALGVLMVVFNQQTCKLFKWIDKKIWNDERRRKFPEYGGNVPTPKVFIILGLSWIISAIVIWFTLKHSGAVH